MNPQSHSVSGMAFAFLLCKVSLCGELLNTEKKSRQLLRDGLGLSQK